MEAFKLFFEQIIPFAIVLVLVALAFVFYHSAKVLIEIRHSVEDVNHKLVELDETVKTVNKLSSTVNTLHSAGGRAVSKAVGATSGNVSMLRSGVNYLLKRNRKAKKK